MLSSLGALWSLGQKKIGTVIMAALLGLLCMVGLSGCSTLNGVFNNPQGQATAKVVVQVAVFNLLTDHPEYQQPLLEITGKVDAYLEGDPEAKVDIIMDLVNQQIKWDKLSPRDALTIQSVMAVVDINLRQQIDNKTLPSDVKLKVRTVLGWINQVANRPIANTACKPCAPAGGGVLAYSNPAFSGPLIASSTEIVSPASALAALLLKSPNSSEVLGYSRETTWHGYRRQTDIAIG